MEINTMITLDDNTTYVLLDEVLINNNKYFFAVKIDSKTNNPTTEYEVFEEDVEDGDVYMTSLDEGPEKQAILLDFTKKYIDTVAEKIGETE